MTVLTAGSPEHQQLIADGRLDELTGWLREHGLNPDYVQSIDAIVGDEVRVTCYELGPNQRPIARDGAAVLHTVSVRLKKPWPF